MSWVSISWARVGKTCLLLFLLAFLGVSVLMWYVNTASFQQIARRRLIAAIESATGGRVEVGSFKAVPLGLQVEIRDLTIHGKEAPGEQPYVHVDRMAAAIDVSSALGARLGFHALTLDHPVIHVIFYPDGSTNQPTPNHNGSSDFERLFSLSARRLEVRHGELLWNDQRIPLEINSNDVSANLSYSFLRLRYSGNVAVGKAETSFDGWRPIAWTGRANFNLDRNGIQIQTLRASSGESQLQASDVHISFEQLNIAGKYQVKLDLAQLAAVTRQQQVKAGTLQISGEGTWSAEDFVSSGEFGLHNGEWRNQTFSGHELSADGKFAIDPRKLSLSKVQGQFLRGSFGADAEVVNWQSPPKATRTQEQAGNVKIRTKNLSLAELLAGLGPAFEPAHGLKVAGDVSGSADLRWKQSIQSAQANVNAEVLPSAKTPNGEIPLTAKVGGTYDFRSGEMELKEFSASAPGAEMHAAGSLANAVKISLTSDNFEQWQAFVSRFFPAGAPLIVHGRAAFNGVASGSPSNLKIAGNLQLQDFASVIASTREPQPQMHWDSLNADLQASSSNLSFRNTLVRRDDSTLRLTGSVGLVDWDLAQEVPLRFHINVQNANADELSDLFGYDHDISGKLSGQLQVSGTRQQPEAQGDFSLLDGTIRGQAFDSASGLVALNGTELAINGLVANSGDARVSGSGSYDLEMKSLQLNLHGTNFGLADIVQVQQSPIRIAGRLDFNAQASGTILNPHVTADLRVRDLSLNDQAEGDFLLNAVSRGSEVHVTGHSDFKHAELQLDGDVRLRDQWPTHINFHFSRLNADPFLESYLRNRTIHHFLIAGDMALDGPLRNPRQLAIQGQLSNLQADAGKTSFRNDGPVLFALSERVVKLDHFHILGDNSDISGDGFAQLDGNRTLNFQARGQLGLKLIQAYDPDITSSGSVTGNGSLTGTLDAPVLKGKVQIQDGAISDINLPSVLSEINGTLLFNQNQVTIESLNARVGGGGISFTGHADLTGKQLDFDLNANADSVRLRYPPGVSSTADAALHWSGSSSGSLLSGDVTVTKLGFTPGFDFGAYLERAAETSSLPQTDPVLNKIRLDLHVATTPDLQMQTSVIRLQGSADLRVRGSAAKPILLGRADVFEGEAYFNGTKYRLERGGVTFSSPAVTTPFLDLEAITRVRDYDVTLSLTGDISKPNGLKVNYRSDPPLPTADIIALLAFGQTTEESAQLQQTNQSAFNQQASSALLAAALNATLNNRAQRLFGNSRIKIDPQGLESETSTITQNGPAVTIEQQVKDNLTVSYTTDVSQTSQQVIRAEYNLSKNVSIVAIRDQNGVVSFDVKIRRRKR